MEPIASIVLRRFKWVEGHADVWRLFSDAEVFSSVIRGLAEPFRDSGVTKVVGIEARGFILGGAVAAELGSGFVAVRKSAGLLPGERLVRVTPPDYRGSSSQLRLKRDSLSSSDLVLLVDDWCETGSQALTARALIEEAGAAFLGASVVVDQLSPDVRLQLGKFVALVEHDALGPSS